MYGEVDPRKEKLVWWLSLPKVTNCFQGLQETSPPGDLLIKKKGFLLFDSCGSHCLAAPSNKLDVRSPLGPFRLIQTFLQQLSTAVHERKQSSIS